MLQKDIEYRSHFLFTLEWLLALHQRYAGNPALSLVHIDFRQPQILGDAFGARDATQMLVEVAELLRISLRKTDLVMRDGASFWILVPLALSETAGDKVRQIVDMAAHNGLDIVDRDISVIDLADPELARAAPETAEAFLAYLRQRHAAAART